MSKSETRTIGQIMQDTGRKRPRAHCPVCDREVAVTTNGRCYAHDRFGFPDGRCPGSGELAPGTRL